MTEDAELQDKIDVLREAGVTYDRMLGLGKK